ncbi:unnamed protein product [Leuciscus chuanchicus]
MMERLQSQEASAHLHDSALEPQGPCHITWFILQPVSVQLFAVQRNAQTSTGSRAEDNSLCLTIFLPSSVSKGNDSQERKSRKSSFDTKSSSDESKCSTSWKRKWYQVHKYYKSTASSSVAEDHQPVTTQTASPVYERSADDESTCSTSWKRKWNQVHKYYKSTASSSVAEDHQPVTVDEAEERPEIKRRRTDRSQKLLLWPLQRFPVKAVPATAAPEVPALAGTEIPVSASPSLIWEQNT